MIEYIDRLASAGSDWLTVLTEITDAKYLTRPYTTSTHFKREADGTKWAAAPCERS
jgi:hypothetical protein